MGKIWHKPLHTRKVWKTMALFDKTVYYLQPFLIQLIDTWRQPLPFPTLFKICYSCFLITLMLLPLILPIVIVICYYAVIQYILESAVGIVYPKNFDIIHYTIQVFSCEIKNDKDIEFLNLYVERWRYITTALASCVDYMRLTLAVAMS